MPQLRQTTSRTSMRTPTTPSKTRIATETTSVKASTPAKSGSIDLPPMPQLRQTTSRSSMRTPTTPSRTRVTTVTTSVKASTPAKSGSAAAKTRVPAQPKSPVKSSVSPSKSPHAEPEKPSPALSIREVIALKRAEAKKVQTKASTSTLSSSGAPDDAPAVKTEAPAQDENNLGRLSLRQIIERARSTGSINLATRSLPCLPSALFDIHLGITPEPLKSVENEPPLIPPTAELQASSRRANNPTWYEAQDLQVLKAWNNQIIEIQPEISLFGSLKTVDLHQNKIVSLPDAIADLMSLTNLDVSHNQLISLPDNLFSLPELININVSHNKLTSLPFNEPFANGVGVRRVSANFFSLTIERASSPLPRLHTLDASHNQINASAIHLAMPTSLTKLDLSSNPLDGDGNNKACQCLIEALGGLSKLAELRMEKASISDDAFPPSLADAAVFRSLRMFDLGEAMVTVGAVKTALKGMRQTLECNYTTEDPPAGVCRLIVGKKMIKEAWEIEIENKAKCRSQKVKEAEPVQDAAVVEPTGPNTAALPPKKVAVKKEVVKESWEVEAEQGLLTEGAKRRARAAAEDQRTLGHGKAPSVESTASSCTSAAQSQAVLSLSSPKYYTESTLTLKLPPCTPPSKALWHNRTFSLATAPLSSLKSASAATTDIAVPTPTLPLSVIVGQPFANSLRALILVNRRMDCCFSLPAVAVEENLLPNLEELDLENCNLTDVIPVSRGGLGPRTNEQTIPLITKLFHNLQTLNLASNALSGFLHDTDALSSLILARGGRRGLKHLRLRGNGIKDLVGLQGIAAMFKGFREVPEWKVDELDLRDNNVEKLPPELGLLPLDVFLVDGNLFRVPQRRIWEREGTKGLLNWLRSRIE